MASSRDGDGKAFADYLKDAPSLEEASAGATTELTGLISRAGEGRFAITTTEGKTYELEVAAVRRFQPLEGQGLAKAATVEIASEALKAAAIRQIKPLIKDIRKDPIKDIIHDKPVYKDVIYDGKHLPKDIIKDPIQDKPVHKDPIYDPVNTGLADTIGPNTAAEGPVPDPWTQIDPSLGRGGLTPFVMATPHQAPAHLLAMQAGAPANAALAPQLKPLATDPHTLKEVAWGETVKEAIRDTLKEMIRDTSKEMVWDTWVEGGPYTLVENGGFDPGVVAQPVNYGMPGFM